MTLRFFLVRNEPMKKTLSIQSNYQLLDSGHQLKLEKINDLLMVRPCPQAIWNSELPVEQWQIAQHLCHRQNDGGGKWEHRSKKPDDFFLPFHFQIGEESLQLEFKISLTNFGHLGIFFEQVSIWEIVLKELISIEKKIPFAERKKYYFINLFAYTGALSSIVAKRGFSVIHVDSSKSILEWAQLNAKVNKVDDRIHFVHDDCNNYLKKIIKNKLNVVGILADPPSWGHGIKKEKWIFEEHISLFNHMIAEAMTNSTYFYLLSSHTHGVQANSLKNLLNQISLGETTADELGIKHHTGNRILPAGIYALTNKKII